MLVLDTERLKCFEDEQEDEYEDEMANTYKIKDNIVLVESKALGFDPIVEVKTSGSF